MAPGPSIHLPIPTPVPNVFSNNAVDDVCLYLNRHRFEEFTDGQ